MKKLRDYKDEIVIGELDKEINELADLSAILGGSGSIVEDDDKDNSIKVIESRMNGFKAAKSMVLKASVEVEGIDNMFLMTIQEKKIFYNLMMIVLFFRRIFKRK